MANPQMMNLVVITPERQVLAESAEAVVIPAHDGEIGVLWDRAPLVCELGIGQLRYTKAGRTVRLFIDGGFAQVLNNHVTVLTGRALPARTVTAQVVSAAARAVDEHQGTEPDTLRARELAQRRLRELRRILTAS